MIQVRENTFETNSSSTHSVVIVEDSDLKRWKNGEIFYISYENRFVSKDEKRRYDNNLFRKEMLRAADEGTYEEEIAEAIKNGNVDELIKAMIEDGEIEVENYDRPLSFDEYVDWIEARDLVQDEHHYTTKNGEEITVLCYYGDEY